MSSLAVVRDAAPRAPNLYTLSEVAERLRVSTKSIMRMHSKGQIKLISIGRKWCCHRAELERIERDGTGRDDE